MALRVFFLRNWSLAILALVAAGCGPEVVFTDPQPEGYPALAEFPQAVQGRYHGFLSDEESEWMLIEPDRILNRTAREWEIPRAQLSRQERFRWNGDQLFDSEQQGLVSYRESKDTLRFRTYELSVLGALGDDLQLRQMGKYYFLSFRDEDSPLWEVAVFLPTDAGLSVWHLSENQLGLLQENGTAEPRYQVDNASAVDYYLSTLPSDAWQKMLSEPDWEPALLERYPN